MHLQLQTLPVRLCGGLLALSFLLLSVLAACSSASVGTAGSAPDPDLAGEIVDGKPRGLFFMTRYWVATSSLEKSCYYFTADGHVYRDPAGLSEAELAALPPGSRGSFSVEGDQLTINWADNSKSSNNLENVEDAAFSWDMGIFVGVKPFADAQALVGTFEGGNSVSFNGGSTIASSTYHFRPDGSYDRGGAVSSSVSSDESTVSVGGTSATAGQWKQQGWQLVLTDAQGKVTQGMAFPVERDDKTGEVKRFYFNGVAFTRQ